MKCYYNYFFLFASLIIFCSCSSSKIRDNDWGIKIKSTSLKNFYKLNDTIYRSEQPEGKEFQDIENMGIKSILNLREDRSDSSVLQFTNLNYFQIKIITADFSDKEIIESLKIIKHSPKPLLIHCKHGSDRTGVVSAMYRIIFENWTKEKALDELKFGGYGFHTRYYNILKYIMNVDTDFIKQIVMKC